MEHRRMARSGKAKSGRKPLKDVSNFSKPATSCSKNLIDKDPALDRLFHSHFCLSNVICQVNELVTHGFKKKHSCLADIEEIESLASVLSDVHTSLKLWVSRFQQAFAISSDDLDNLEHRVVAATTEEQVVRSPEKSHVEPLMISSSPLVSWHNTCKADSGAQLFLLTPLPQTKLSLAKDTCLSRRARQDTTVADSSEILSMTKYSVKHMATQDLVLESTKFQTTMKKLSRYGIMEHKSNVKTRFRSPQPSSKCTEKPACPMTPFRLISPSKACLPLEPVTHNVHNDTKQIHVIKGTANILSSQHPKIFGFIDGIKKKQPTGSFDLFFSPSKTCTVKNPPRKSVCLNGSLGSSPSSDHRQSTHVATLLGKSNQSFQTENAGTKLAQIVSTPAWKNLKTPLRKDCECTSKRGRQPGESTLKRELWNEFQAVSMKGLHYRSFQEHKGETFLDRLEEGSLSD